MNQNTNSFKDEKKYRQISEIICHNCEIPFSIDKDYIGIVTCPYCGEYVEG